MLRTKGDADERAKRFGFGNPCASRPPRVPEENVKMAWLYSNACMGEVSSFFFLQCHAKVINLFEERESYSSPTKNKPSEKVTAFE